MDFDRILKDLKDTLLQILGEKFEGFKQEAKRDIESFLNALRDKLERLTKLLADDEINLEEFEWLVKGQRDLLKMKALQTTGVSKTSLGHTKNKIVKTIIDVITRIVFKC